MDRENRGPFQFQIALISFEDEDLKYVDDDCTCAPATEPDLQVRSQDN